MASRFDGGRALNINIPAFALVSGTITTPIVSGWLRLVNVDTIALILASTSSADITWTAEVATNSLGANAKPLPNPPTFPTGTGQSATVTVTMPGDEYTHLRITATKNSGTGTVTANPGLIVGAPVGIARDRQTGMFYSANATDTLAGTHVLEYSPNWDGRPQAGGPSPIPALKNTPNSPAVWGPAVDASNSAISIAAKVATTAQALAVRLGLLEFVAIRSSFTPTAGAGTMRVWFNAKG